eukprot:9507811-Heterocapsa_arctica.AAC.1
MASLRQRVLTEPVWFFNDRPTERRGNRCGRTCPGAAGQAYSACELAVLACGHTSCPDAAGVVFQRPPK